MPEANPALNAVQWGGILALISLDVTQPLLPAAGWQSTQPQRALELLRGRILSARAAQAQAPDREVPLAQNFQQALASECGPDELQRFQTWIERTFPNTHAKSPHWSGWRIAFDQWLRQPELRPEIPDSPDNWKNLLLAYSQTMDVSAWQEKADAAKGALLSDWDLLMFARRGYAFDDDVADPFISVLSWIERHQFQEFWRQRVASLHRPTRETLRKSADAILQSMDVWMPGPLEEPTT